MSVFISYAVHDKPYVERVIRELKSRKMVGENEMIIDTSKITHAGDNVREKVRRAIETASKVVVVWSGAAAGSNWVNYEAGMADALDRPILVVLPKGAAAQLPSNLRDRQVLELEYL